MYRSHEIIDNSQSIFSKDSQDDGFYDVHVQSSLLTVLDDKNKTISTLKRQLQNQKVQLTYYLKKELTPTKITKLSKSCCSEALEGNMGVKIAMTNFNKKMGIKSNALCLYERMCYIDERISSSLDDQEFILRKIVNKLCELVKHANGNIEFKVQFSNFITDPFHIELFNKLLNATINLRKKLDTFRICCNRLITIEDERNAIVDQIYTLPTDQRMSCNYLVSVQTEKMQLENELQQIIKDQRKDRERIKDLGVIEEKLSNLQFQLNSLIFRSDDGQRISKMLQEVNTEARILLDLTKEQRKKFEDKLARLKEKNLNLEKILIYLKLALDNRDLTPNEMLEYDITTVEDFKLFDCIKKEIDSSKNRLNSKLFDELQTNQWEIELLKNKMSQLLFERNELKALNVKLKTHMRDMKFNKELDLASLREERDIYKKQVEDLEAIRQAYAQLLHQQPAVTKLEREYLKEIRDRDDQIYDLEKSNRDVMKELKSMKNTINKQNREIKQQAKIIEDLRQHTRNVNESEGKHLEYVYRNRNSENSVSSRDITNLPEHQDAISYVELYQQEIYVQEKIINWVDEGGSSSLQCTNKPVAFASRRLDINYDSTYKETDDKRESKRSVTCVKLFSSKRGQTSDVMESIVTSSIEEESQRNALVCLDVNRNSNKGDGLKVMDSDKLEIDNELLKDCSEESISNVCYPKHKLKEPHYQQRVSSKNDQVEY